jgi:uncharacterized protein (DUF1330 family)
MKKAFLPLFAVVAVGCSSGSSDGGDPMTTEPFEDATLDTYELAVLPDFSVILELLERPDERFVMVNNLVFKEAATGEYEGITGIEAYAIYINGLSEAQMEIGSRLIWAGSVQAQVVGESDPTFQALALLEYASPQTFVEFAQSPGEAPDARSAGLLGQWLIASTTMQEDGLAEAAPSDPLPSAAEVATRTGLSEDQAERLLDGPADEVVYVVDLLSFSDVTGDAYQPYRDALNAATTVNGGTTVWCGSYDTYVLGTADAPFQEMVVRSYPNRGAYIDTLADPAVLEASIARVDGLETHWIYTAGETDVALDF